MAWGVSLDLDGGSSKHAHTRGPARAMRTAHVRSNNKRGTYSVITPLAGPLCIPALGQGVVYEGREDITPDSYLYDVTAVTECRTLKEVRWGRG